MQGGSGKRVKDSTMLRVGSWNIGSLTGKSTELVMILKKRKISIRGDSRISRVWVHHQKNEGKNVLSGNRSLSLLVNN